MANPHTLDIAQFRLRFPAFANVTLYPDVMLEGYWTMAVAYMGAYDGPLICGDQLQLALEQLTAHLLQSWVILSSGGPTPAMGPLVAATVDKVQVSLMPPPAHDGWQFWLASTPYGLMLWGLLSAAAAGGFYVGGLPERRAFRKVYGTFRNG